MKKIDLSREFFNREKCFLNFFDSKEALTIFDVGANTGQSVDAFLDSFPNGNIYSFEPQSDVFDELKKNCANRKNTHVFNKALSCIHGESIFYVNKFNKTSSSMENFDLNSSAVQNDVHPKLGLRGENPIFETRIDVDTLDRVFGALQLEKINILKLDCQTHEPYVLDGAFKTLKEGKIDLISVEIIFDDVYGKDVSFLDIESRLSPHGFRLFDICHIYKNFKSMRTHWVEAVYLNTRMLDINRIS
jgi:FkbM family methyltransferase